MKVAEALKLAAILFVGFLLWGFINDPFGFRAGGVAKAKVERAETQATVNASAAEVAGRVDVQTRIIHETSERVIHDVQQAPSASTPLPADVRASLCAGLERMRDGKPGCDDPGSAEPRGGL